MIHEQEVRARLADALVGGGDFDDFEDWLIAASWNMHRDSSESAQSLVSGIELALAEFSNGHLDQDELRSKLLHLLNDVALSVSLPAPSASASSRRPLPRRARAGSPRLNWVAA
jgi:hypothetical protein